MIERLRRRSVRASFVGAVAFAAACAGAQPPAGGPPEIGAIDAAPPASSTRPRASDAAAPDAAAPEALPACTPRLDDAREAYALAEREYGRAASAASPVVAAHVFEAIPHLFIDVSDTNLPTFTPEFVRLISSWPTSNGRFVFSRELLGRVRALSRVVDTTDVMRAKAAALLELAVVDDRRLTDYAASPDEPPPAPPKSAVRRTALAALARSNLFSNDDAARAFLVQRLAAPRDDVDALLVAPAAHAYLSPIRAAAVQSEAAARTRLLRAWIDDVRRRVGAPGDAISAELAIGRTFLIGAHAPDHGLGSDASRLVDDVLKKKGAVPLAAGDAERQRALYAVAAAARFDLDHPKRGIHRTPRLYEGATQRAAEGTSEMLVRGELRSSLRDATAAARTKDLEAERDRIRYEHARCYVLRELAQAAPPASADARFDEIVAPILAGGRVTLTFANDGVCRLDAALAMEGVAEKRRIELLSRVLRAKDATIAPHACAGNAPSPMFGSAEDDRLELRLGLVARHPEWLDTSAELRAWLFANGADGALLERWLYVDAARLYERALGAAAQPGAPDARAAGELVRAWLAIAPPAPGRKSFAFERVLVLAGRYAPAFGLRDDARRAFAALRFSPAEGNVDFMLARALAVATALLEP